MAVAAARITAFLKAVADAGADLLAKIAFGTPGSQVVYPEATPDNQATTGARDTGSVYPGVVIPGLLAQIGAEMDKAACIWAAIGTEGVGGSPVFVSHPNVLSVAKDEVADSLRVNLDPGFTTGNFFWIMLMPQVLSVPVIGASGTDFFYCQFYNPTTGVIIPINNRLVYAFACGQV